MSKARNSTIGYDRLFDLQQKRQKDAAPREREPDVEPSDDGGAAPEAKPRTSKPKRHTTFHLTVEAHQILEEMAVELRRLADHQGYPRPNKSVLVEALIREAAVEASEHPDRVLGWFLSRRAEMEQGDGGNTKVS